MVFFWEYTQKQFTYKVAWKDPAVLDMHYGNTMVFSEY